MAKIKDIYAHVTDKIITELETGAEPVHDRVRRQDAGKCVTGQLHKYIYRVIARCQWRSKSLPSGLRYFEVNNLSMLKVDYFIAALLDQFNVVGGENKNTSLAGHFFHPLFCFFKKACVTSAEPFIH